VRNQVLIASTLHTSGKSSGLMEFFDTKENWGASSIKVGEYCTLLSWLICHLVNLVFK